MSAHDDPHPRLDPDDTLGESILTWVDEIADRFEAAWRAALKGGPPARIEDFVGQTSEPRRSVLLRELIRLDVVYRHRHGEGLSTQDYLGRFEFLDHEWVRQVIAAATKSSQPGSPPNAKVRGEVAGAEQQSNDQPAAALRQARATRIRCPHCQVVIEVVDVAPESDVTCPSCGTRIERPLASTLKLSPEEMAKLAQTDHDTSGPVEVPPPDANAAQPAEPAAAPTRMFGRYELQSLLGRGAFGEVWKAFDTTLHRSVALKLLRSQAEVTPGDEANAKEARQRFEREARTLVHFQHPSVVRAYEFAEIQGRLSIAYELIDGIDLKKLLAKMRVAEHVFTFTHAAELCGHVAEALDAAHRAGIVHRDLKPANILMARSDPIHGVDPHSPDESGHYKPFITDFGLAKRDAPAEYTMTQDHTLLGTPEYMSPEQWRDSHAVGPASDIYSVGVILYELLTGRVPFPCTTDKWILLRDLVLKEDPIAPRRLNLAVPVSLETICLKCLEKDPSRRFPTAAALAQELHRFLHGEPIQTPPITQWERASKWCRRNPVVGSLTAADLRAAAFAAAGFLGLAVTSVVAYHNHGSWPFSAFEVLQMIVGMILYAIFFIVTCSTLVCAIIRRNKRTLRTSFSAIVAMSVPILTARYLPEPPEPKLESALFTLILVLVARLFFLSASATGNVRPWIRNGTLGLLLGVAFFVGTLPSIWMRSYFENRNFDLAKEQFLLTVPEIERWRIKHGTYLANLGWLFSLRPALRTAADNYHLKYSTDGKDFKLTMSNNSFSLFGDSCVYRSGDYGLGIFEGELRSAIDEVKSSDRPSDP